MRKLLMMAGVLALVSVAARAAEGQVKFGVGLNWGDDADLGLDARLNFPVGNITQNGAIEGQVAFDYYFPNGFNFWTLTGNGLYTIKTSGSVTPHVGAGLGLAHSSYDIPNFTGLNNQARPNFAIARLGESNGSDLFLNLLGGLRFKPLGNVQPFAEARLQVGSGSQLILSGGVYFGRS